MKKILLGAALIASFAFLQGCGPSYVVRERPVSTYTVRPVAPRPGYIWIEGDWYRLADDMYNAQAIGLHQGHTGYTSQAIGTSGAKDGNIKGAAGGGINTNYLSLGH